MTVTAYISPLAATLARVSALDAYLRAEVIADHIGGWFPVSELATDPQLLDRTLHAVMAPFKVDQQPIADDRRIAAAFLINRYAWVVPAAAIAGYLIERRVPDLDPANMALRFGQPGAETAHSVAVAFGSQRMAVLPDDPAAEQPDVLVLADQIALRDWLRTQLEAHMTPLIEAVYRRTGFGRRAQWNLVADDCAALFLWAGKYLPDQQRAHDEGLAFVHAAGSPLSKSNTNFFTLHCSDRSETFRQRGGCCLYYKLPQGDNCSTCVLISHEQRNERLLAEMAQATA